jgi:hypothetical protein
MQLCKVCGGTTSPNPKKVPTKYKPVVNPKLPDFICNQDNGKCGSDVQYTNYKGELVNGFNPTPAWKPKEGGFDQYAQRPIPKGTPMAPAPNGEDGYVAARDITDQIAEADREFTASMPPPAPPVRPNLTPTATIEPEDEKWLRKGEQMNRSALAKAAIQSGRKLDQDLQVELETYENWVLNRKFIPY